MRIAEFELREAGGAPADDAVARLIQDVLWAHADTGIEHVRARAGPDAILVSILFDDSVPDPVHRAAEILRRAVITSARLTGWTVSRPPRPDQPDDPKLPSGM